MSVPNAPHDRQPRRRSGRGTASSRVCDRPVLIRLLGSAIPFASGMTNERLGFLQANRCARTSRCLLGLKCEASIQVKRSCRPEAIASFAAARSVRLSVSATTRNSREAWRAW